MHLTDTQYVPVGTPSEINHKNLWEGLWMSLRLVVCSVLYVAI